MFSPLATAINWPNYLDFLFCFSGSVGALLVCLLVCFRFFLFLSSLPVGGICCRLHGVVGSTKGVKP